jgi:hypothetical protein
MLISITIYSPASASVISNWVIPETIQASKSSGLLSASEFKSSAQILYDLN